MKFALFTLFAAQFAAFSSAGFVNDIISVVDFLTDDVDESFRELVIESNFECSDKRVLDQMNSNMSVKHRQMACKFLRGMDKIPSVSTAASCAPTFFVSGAPGFMVCLGMSQNAANMFAEAANTCYWECVAAGHKNHRGSAAKVSQSCKQFCVDN